MKGTAGSFCHHLIQLGFSWGILFFSLDPVTAFQTFGVAAPELSPFSSRRILLRREPTKSTFTGTAQSASFVVSATSLSTEEGKLLVESMISNNTAAGAAAAVTTIAIITSVLSWRRTRQVQHELDFLKEEIRKSETLNQRESNVHKNGRQTSGSSANAEKLSGKNGKTRKRTQEFHTGQEDLAVMRIGVIRSIYRLCVGTPRQGLLAPDARGRIELDKIGNTSTAATVFGLEDFSYIWVLFHFHLNTQSVKKERRFKSKIAPPALGGKKVGIYSTRSPHRHNPIGITLCKLDRVQVHGPHEVTLHVSGLDLVDGTPVLDIKPYVPVYDSVNNIPQVENLLPSSGMALESSTLGPDPLSVDLQLPTPRVPGWVEGGLATKRNVVITKNAKNELEEILRHDAKALDFYGQHCFVDLEGDSDNTIATVLRVIQQVLSIDVRSSHQTRKARKGDSQAERSERVRTRFDIKSALETGNDKNDSGPVVREKLPENKMCTQQLDNLLIYFSIKTNKVKRESSEGSGAEDGITVESIRLLQNSAKEKRGRR